MRKWTLGLAVMASLGLGALATPASAVPGSPTGVSAADTVTHVMHRGRMHHHHHMMRPRHHHHHRMMRMRHRHHHHHHHRM